MLRMYTFLFSVDGFSITYCSHMIEFRWIALIDFTTTESEMVRSMKDKSVAAMHEYKLKTIPQIIENKTFFIAWNNEFYFFI